MLAATKPDAPFWETQLNSQTKMTLVPRYVWDILLGIQDDGLVVSRG